MDNPTIELTPMMEAIELVQTFNNCMDREGWRTVLAGTRERPAVKFSPRSLMADITLDWQTKRFTVSFSKMACAWGDYITAARRALFVVLTTLKATGSPVEAPLSDDDGTLRIEYNSATKETYIWCAALTDAWKPEAESPFKALEGVL